ncbi:MAG TPA: AI-2E family transporter [Gammaproteobacteria bacterium]|nr:AI-2 transport protein TqsA [bacterium BMS3Abin11]GMT39567.1 MAG: membrane protein [bacterium]HDH08514.1 AI-2E family transporter [Gammaproteobacteria bacterium]HDH16065.1 AI-2E family transporter [Gammaproteobacteria bacterium]HDZ79068.1 AI-2E family transporter [Gammaproteobacteria bacterium]
MYIPHENGSALRIALGVASFVIIVAGMKAAATLIVPFLLSGFIAIICAPAINSLKSRGLPMWLALTIVVILIGLAGTVFISILGGSIHKFSTQLPEYQSRLQGDISKLSVWLNARGITWLGDEVRQYINPSIALSYVGKVFNGLGNLLANGFLIFLTVIFLLFEGVAIKYKMQIISGDTEESQTNQISGFLESVNKYMAIKSLTSLLTGILIAIWLWVFDIEYSLLWGLLAFILNYIPNIGSIIAAVPAVILALVTAGPLAALWVIAGYLLVNILIGNIIEPKFLGDRLGLSTLVVFLSLVFWGWILGTTGMFLSVPLTMVIKLGLDSRPETKWIAVLLGSGKPPETLVKV